MTTVDDLAAWLTQIWDEDQAQAEVAAKVYGPAWVTGELSETVSGENGGYVACGPYDGYLVDELRYFIARHDPAAVLARIAADRQILALHQEAWARSIADDPGPEGSEWLLGHRWGLQEALKILALPHADRPGYREEWKP